MIYNNILFKKSSVFMGILIIYCGLPLHSVSAQGLIDFEKDTLYLGEIKQGAAAVDFIFTFTNTGDVPVIIEKIGVSCGCTAVSWSMGPIAPMKKGEVRGIYTPRTPGAFRKRLIIFSDSKVDRLALYIVGVVKSKTESTPSKG